MNGGSTIQLLQLADVPPNPEDRVFCYSRHRALGVAFLVLSASGGLIAFGMLRDYGLAYYLAAVLLLSLLIFRKFVIARFRPSNWLVRMNKEGLFIQFRSYLNHHFPEDDLTVTFIPYHEIRSARLIRERRSIPYRDMQEPFGERSTEHRRRLVELDLVSDVGSLQQAIADEPTRRPSGATLYKHYPIQMASPSVVQVEWGVVPSAENFLDALRPYTAIATAMAVSKDYNELHKLGRAEQEAELRELINSGQTMDAIYIARKLYSYDLTQARAFVEGLHGSDKRTSDAGGTRQTH